MLQKAKSSGFTLDTFLGSLEWVVGYKEWKNLSHSKWEEEKVLFVQNGTVSR